jgi:RNA-directed DNA polymerase
MNGVENEILKVKYCVPVRFADDILILARTNEKLLEALEKVKDFIKPRGLKINNEKTVISRIEDGFEYLGYSIREHVDVTRQEKKGFKLKKGIVIQKPSKTAIKSFKQKIKECIQKFGNLKAGLLILKLNPIITG